METKDIMVVGVWTFAIVLLVGTMAAEADMLPALMVFFVAIAVSVGAVGIQGHKS